MSLDPTPEDLAPVASAPDDDAPSRARRALREFLGTGGVLSRERAGYEERPQQLAMAEAVLEALERSTYAVIEAGTGTGKTLAYLVPAILSGRKVVVSTATKALQEQLVDKDLPLLRSLGLEFSYAVMKGRANYLCQLRHERFDQQPVFVSRDERDRYVRLGTWARETETGDRAELDLPENYVAWRDVSSTAETCLGQECPRYSTCHVVRMRQRAQEADVVVVNHHLFFADLALRRSPASRAGAEVIPRYEAVVFDEAHNIEEVATEFFGAQVSNYRLYDLCRDVDRTAKAQESWPRDAVLDATRHLAQAADAFFDELAAKAPLDAAPQARRDAPAPKPRVSAPPPPPPPTNLSLFEKPAPRPAEPAKTVEEILARSVVLETPPELLDAGDRRENRWTLEPGALLSLTAPRDGLREAMRELESLLESIGGDQPGPEIEGFVRRSAEAREALATLTDQDTPGLVYWAEVRGRGVFLRASPIDVAGMIKDGLFGEPRPVVLTSATLATGGDTGFFQRRIGLKFVEDAKVRELVLPSPFDYATPAALYFPRHLPEPTSEQFLDVAVNEIAALIALAKGRTFVLFTSLRAMNEAHRRLAPRIPYQVLLQGQRPKGALVRAFREEPSVLFATASFWEGVDVPGDALSMVIIDKLPFASPGDPLVAARLKAIEEREGSPFGEYQLPSAAIALKQGFGRLIRTQADTGAVAILDKRLWTKGYGSFFRRSLPACPTFSAFPDLKQWWRETRRHEAGN